MESVLSLAFVVGMVGSAFEIINTLYVSDILHRAAQAVARDNSLRQAETITEAQLKARAWRAIRAEIGDRLDPDLLTVDINVYDNPTAMLRNQVSSGENRPLTGNPYDMVVVRLRFEPNTPLGWMRRQLQPGEKIVFPGIGIGRNQAMAGLPEATPVGTAVP